MKIAIVGATGEVGKMMISCLNDYSIDYEKLTLFASQKSAGQQIKFRKKTYTVQLLTDKSLQEKYDYILFSAGSSVSKQYAQDAVNAGSIVIDNSSAFRRIDTIPLIVPEINGTLLKDYQGIIANPNCSTIQMVLLLNIINKLYTIEKVVITTFQSVSGSGYTGISTLLNQRNGDKDIGKYPRIIDLNVIPQIGDFDEFGYCEEEIKMTNESRKILNIYDLDLTATTVRVPVLYCHSESIYIKLKKDVIINQIIDHFNQTDYIKYNPIYDCPIDVQDSNLSHVSRIRYAGSKNSITLWNVSNNVRLGAAANAVKILKMHYQINKS